ncbi:hypothetical protein ACLMJK_002500 [Lecanora helva]
MGDNNNSLHTEVSKKNLGPVFLGIDWTVFSISTIVVLIRLYTRGWITRNLGWDDAVIALTQAITAVGKGFVVTEVSYGLGQHRYDLSIENYRNFLKYSYLDTAQFFIALATCKISICLFLLRLSQFNKLKRVLWYLIGFLIISHSILFLLVVLQCKPIHKAWDLGAPGSCFSQQTVVDINIVQGVISFLTDLICAAFPIVLLRNLSIRRQSYIGLCFLMGLGVVTGAIAIARTATMNEIKSEDLSWDGIPNAITRIFEVNIGNIAACIPLLKPFIRFMHAMISGRDPHQILHRKTSCPETHTRWFRREWGGPSSWTRDKDIGSGQQEIDMPPNARKMKAMGCEGISVRTELSKTVSIALPMQGVRKSNGDEEGIPDMPDIRDSEHYRFSDSPRTDSGQYWEMDHALNDESRLRLP